MSISTENDRILIARNRIRDHLVSLGIADGTEHIDELAPMVETLGVASPYIVFTDSNNIKRKIYIEDDDVSKLCFSGNNYTTIIDGYDIKSSDILAVNLNGSEIKTIGNHFLSNCTSLNYPVILPDGLVSIGISFMSSCHSYNQPLVLPSTLKIIGASFLHSCISFNQPLALPTGITSIAYGFLMTCSSFDSPISLPSGLTSIDYNFMRGCMSYNQPLTLPEKIVSINSGFMTDCRSMKSSLLVNSTACPNDESSLSSFERTAECYTNGIPVIGSGAETWKSSLPNRNTLPYRKLL